MTFILYGIPILIFFIISLIMYKINEKELTNYNKILIQLWQATMDIQYVIDPYACVQYLADYVTKNEKNFSSYLMELAKKFSGLDLK